MGDADLDGVVQAAASAFPDHPEDRACFENRLALYPQGCWVLQDGQGVAGYLIAYPWRADAAPALNAALDALPDDAAVLYLHDLALLPRVRGRGATNPILDWVMRRAASDGWPAVALVAVNGTAPFWARQGFEIRTPPGMAQKLGSYGADARYMVRRLQPRVAATM